MIGGKNQDGLWKLDARYNVEDLTRRIQKVARFGERITLTRLDGADYLRERLPPPDDCFIYLDPPYVAKGEGLYQNFYRERDQVEIAGLVKAWKSRRWVVSYDANVAILDLYRGNPSMTYQLSYSTANRYRGSEVMFQSGSQHPRPAIPREHRVISCG